MQKFYADSTTKKYLGSWDGIAPGDENGPPVDAIEIPLAPTDGRQMWNGNGWADLTEDLVALQQIKDIELTITDRRIREAILGIDNGWLDNANAQIEALRTNL